MALLPLRPFALLAVSAACSSPACPTETLEQSVTYPDGFEYCPTFGPGLPQPWIDLDDCEIRALMPPGATCAGTGGAPIEGQDGRVRCQLARLVVEDRSPGAPVPAGAGWFFDDFSDAYPCPDEPAPPGFRFTFDAPPGIEIELLCEVPERPESGPNATCFVDDDCDAGLVCDPVRDRCTARCSADADCAEAGLAGWVCDTDRRSDIDPRERDDAPHLHCVNPGCR